MPEKPRYLVKQSTSDNWYFRLVIPKDARSKLTYPDTIKRTTKTSDLKKAQRLADRWAAEIQEDIERARGADSGYWSLKRAVEQEREAGLSDEEIFDLGLDVIEPEQERDLKKALGKIIVLKDHVEGYRKYISEHNAAGSVATKMNRLKALVERFDTLDDITVREVMKWGAEMGGARATQEVKRSCYRDFYDYLSKKVLFQTLDPSPFKHLVTARGKQKHKQEWTSDEFQKMLDNTTEENGRYLMLAAYTGRRSVALANLKAADVDLEAKTFTFRIDKGLTEEDVPHIVPIHTKLLPVVLELIRKSRAGYLINVAGEGYMRGRNLSNRITNLTTSLGYNNQGKSLHSFRTTVINKLYNNGYNKLIVRSVVGQSLGKATDERSYLKPIKVENIRDAVETIEW
jgi:integrase